MILRRSLSAVVLFFFLSPLVLQAAGSKPNERRSGIGNLVQLEDGVVGGGLVSEKTLRIAANDGYRTVIDIRTPPEGTEKEKRVVESLGMRYVNIPFYYGKAGPAEVEELARVLSEEGAKPAILHCRSGSRVKLLWEMYEKLKGRTE